MMEREEFKFADNAKNEQGKIEEKAEEGKVEIKPYKVFGQDFCLSDPDLIEYYKMRMKMMAIKYRLVGKINAQGQYKIPDPIRYNLVEMEKEIEETGEDFYKAIALYMKKHFYFHIKIVQIEDGKAKASLFLSEYVEDFLGLEYIVTHIADFTDVYDDDFRIKVRKAFNLVDVQTKIDDFAVPDLAVVMQDCFDLELIVGGLYDMASQIFVMRLLKALEEGGEAGAKVLAKYRELLKGKDIEINDKFRYSHYKALLDRAIDELGGYEQLGLDPNLIKSIIKDMNGTVKAIDNASNRPGAIEIEKPHSAEKKSAPKSKSGGSKKTASKSSSGGDKKSKPKKKDDKKKEEKKASSGGVPANYMDNPNKKPDDKPKVKSRPERPLQPPKPQRPVQPKPERPVPETVIEIEAEDADIFAIDDFGVKGDKVEQIEIEASATFYTDDKGRVVAGEIEIDGKVSISDTDGELKEKRAPQSEIKNSFDGKTTLEIEAEIEEIEL